MKREKIVWQRAKKTFDFLRKDKKDLANIVFCVLIEENVFDMTQM